MIGLIFFSAAVLWLVLTVYLTKNIPRWCGVIKYAWLLRVVLVPVLLVGPFVDHIIGMRQFERLCEQRTAISVSPDAETVKRGKSVMSTATILPGFLINIKSYTVSYIDLDTNKTFLTYDYFSTSGGRLVSLALMDGTHGCSADDRENKNHRQLQQIPIYQKIVNGDSK